MSIIKNSVAKLYDYDSLDTIYCSYTHIIIIYYYLIKLIICYCHIITTLTDKYMYNKSI